MGQKLKKRCGLHWALTRAAALCAAPPLSVSKVLKNQSPQTKMTNNFASGRKPMYGGYENMSTYRHVKKKNLFLFVNVLVQTYQATIFHKI